MIGKRIQILFFLKGSFSLLACTLINAGDIHNHEGNDDLELQISFSWQCDRRSQVQMKSERMQFGNWDSGEGGTVQNIKCDFQPSYCHSFTHTHAVHFKKGQIYDDNIGLSCVQPLLS